VCLASGCTKKYDSVEDYAKDMQAVQKAQKSYSLEFNQSFNHTNAKYHYKVYKKNNLWKYEDLSENHQDYCNTYIFDGNEEICHGDKKWAVITTMPEAMKKVLKPSYQPVVSYSIFHWYRPLRGYVAPDVKPEFVNDKAKMNGFDCRLIRYNDKYEVCVSDKLGIAVYVKTKSYNSYISKTIETITNVIKADTKELPDSEFVLPSDKVKITEEQAEEKTLRGEF